MSPMQFISGLSGKSRGHSRIASGAGIFLATAVIAPLSLWQIRVQQAADERQQYNGAVDSLAQLRIDRQRVIEELTRNKRLVAWTQARIDEAKINVAPRNRPALPQLSSQIDNDMKDYFEVSLAEDELNLADAHKRRALLVDEKSLIDQKMVSHETLIERLREALDGD